MSSYRKQRVAASVREIISVMIQRGEIKDPRVSTFVQLNEIDIASDFSFARIHVSSFESEEELERSVEGLNAAAGFIQSRLGRQMRTRNTPKLVFKKDTSIHKGMEINAVIEELHKDS